MCTAIAVHGKAFYFGRNMDLEGHFGECVTVTPRNYDFRFRMAPHVSRHYAMIGMARVIDGFPLYADACNEYGLCMAGLHFPEHTQYAGQPILGKESFAPYELIPWILGRSKSADDAVDALKEIALIDLPFRPDLPNTPLHWFVADRMKSLAVEYTREGMRVFKNPAGVLTNAPPFDFQIANLCRYGNLSNRADEGDFAKKLGLRTLGMGLSAIGLPGDYSSPSRFVKAAWLRANMPIVFQDDDRNVSQLFAMLASVAPPYGSVLTTADRYHHTTYSCVIDAQNGIYQYKTYFDWHLHRFDMHSTDLDGGAVYLLSAPLDEKML